MYWIGFILALSSGLFSIGLVRSFIRKYYPDIKDSVFDKTLVILLAVGLSVTTIKYYIDQNEIKILGKDVEVSKYQEISLYSAMGNKSGKVSGVHMVGTPINDWNNKYAHYEGGQIIFSCDSGAKEACREVIDKMPRYPFAYYFLAKCLKEENDNSWLEMAEKAKELLEITTQIAGHKTDHDKVLGEVNSLLK